MSGGLTAPMREDWSDELLGTLLTSTEYGALRTLRDGIEISGRGVAAVIDVSPTTAVAALTRLQAAGLATSIRIGRADRWRLNKDNPVICAWLSYSQGSASV